MSEENTAPDIPEQAAGKPYPQIALVLAVIAVVASGWQWLDSRQQANALQNTLAGRLSQFEEKNRESLVLAKRAEEITAQANAKIAYLEQRLEESRAQQESLQTLYLELANNRDEWTISEVEQLLIIAGQQLQLAGNVKPALLALQTADSRLQQLDKPQVIALRKTLAKDIQKLQALPSVDIVGMSLKLEALVDGVQKLPLGSERHPVLDPAVRPDWDSNPWHRLTQEIWQDIKRLIRIERMDEAELPLLAPDQAYFLRENLKLRLLAARIALLQHDETTYRTDLHTAEGWIKRYFDPHDAGTQQAVGMLQQLMSSSITIQIPDIGESLNAVSQYKLALERSRS